MIRLPKTNLEKLFPEQTHLLKTLFDLREENWEKTLDRLNQIYEVTETAWKNNLQRFHNRKIKYLLISEAAPWSDPEKEINYFYLNFHGSWCRRIWNSFYPDSPPKDLDRIFEMLALKGFLLVDSIPFAMEYSAKIRAKREYSELVKCCFPYLINKIRHTKIKFKYSGQLKVALAFKLNGKAIIEAHSGKINLPNAGKMIVAEEMIAADGSGYPGTEILKKIYHLVG